LDRFSDYVTKHLCRLGWWLVSLRHPTAKDVFFKSVQEDIEEALEIAFPTETPFLDGASANKKTNFSEWTTD